MFEEFMEYMSNEMATDIELMTNMYALMRYYLMGLSMQFAAMSLFARYTLGCKPRKVPLIILCVWLLLPFIDALCQFKLTMFYADYHEIVAVVLILVSFRQAKIYYFLPVAAFLECVSLTILHILGFAFGSMPSYVDGIVFAAIAVISSIFFVSPARSKFREMLVSTPRWALIYGAVVFYVMILIHSLLTPGGMMERMDDLIVNYYLSTMQTLDDPQVYQEFKNAMNTIDAGTTALIKEGYVFLLEGFLCASYVVFMIFSRSNRILKQQNANFERQIEAQAEHYKNLAAANAEVRRFRHDFKNVRFALEKLLAEGKKAEALELMQEFSMALDAKNRYMILFDTGNGIADALLTDKMHRAREKQAVITFAGAIPYSALAPTDLCVLLGNSIDNAIEACDELPNGMERKITVECNCSSGFLFLTVRNPIAKPVSICDNRVHTTKKDRALHGFGISSMHKVAKKYDGTLKLDADEGFFTVSIDLCLPASDAVFAS
jgi:hypothetical protein